MARHNPSNWIRCAYCAYVSQRKQVLLIHFLFFTLKTSFLDVIWSRRHQSAHGQRTRCIESAWRWAWIHSTPQGNSRFYGPTFTNLLSISSFKWFPSKPRQEPLACCISVILSPWLNSRDTTHTTRIGNTWQSHQSRSIEWDPRWSAHSRDP